MTATARRRRALARAASASESRARHLSSPPLSSEFPAQATVTRLGRGQRRLAGLPFGGHRLPRARDLDTRNEANDALLFEPNGNGRKQNVQANFHQQLLKFKS